MVDDAFKAQVDAYVDEVWEDVVEDIRTLVRIPSVEDVSKAQEGMPWGPACNQALKAALAIAARLGLDAHECAGYIGYADLPGASARQIATIAHTDIVPVGTGWTVDPYDVTRREGYLLGRGVIDDKGPFMLSLYAAHFFVRECARTGRQLPYTLRCLVGNCEETTMADVDWYLAHYEEPAFTFSPDAMFPLICGEKGVYHGQFTHASDPDGRIVMLDGGTVANAVPGLATAVVRGTVDDLPSTERVAVEAAEEQGCVRLTATGIGSHAAFPQESLNAIGLLVDYLLEHEVCSASEREFLQFEHLLCAVCTDGSSLGIATADDKFGPLTAIGGTVRTTDGHFAQTIDVRYPTSTTGAALTADLTKLCGDYGCSYALLGDKEPFYIEPSSPEIQALLTTYREYSGDMTEPLVIGGGTYARKFHRACAFGPMDTRVKLPDWVGEEHSPDEGVSEETLKQGLKIYIVSLARLMELDLG